MLKSCINSIPRWECARELSPKFHDRDNRHGIAKAVRSTHDKTKRVIQGGDILVEDLIRGDDNRYGIRAGAVKSLLASLTYMLKSHEDYTSTAWSILRMEKNCDDDITNLRTTRCCDETGIQRKFASFLDKNQHLGNDDMDFRVKRTFASPAEFVMTVDGFSTKDADQSFSRGRNAGAA